MIVTLGLTSCGDKTSEWVGTYMMTDELGNEWTLTIAESEYQDENPGELTMRIGDMFSDFGIPDGNIITCELLDGSGTAPLELQSDGRIAVSCDATDSMYAPPIGTYVK